MIHFSFQLIRQNLCAACNSLDYIFIIPLKPYFYSYNFPFFFMETIRTIHLKVMETMFLFFSFKNGFRWRIFPPISKNNWKTPPLHDHEYFMGHHVSQVVYQFNMQKVPTVWKMNCIMLPAINHFPELHIQKLISFKAYIKRKINKISQQIN